MGSKPKAPPPPPPPPPIATVVEGEQAARATKKQTKEKQGNQSLFVTKGQSMGSSNTKLGSQSGNYNL
ncbi:MAG: hypothetical protein Unbinned15contig1001_50 [Prokaryotic dsDNA virus sp.]|nr:MAG: hypothetical protein Unbinned15contig1001_50 [Prokaryotic dsDNA virus sp.]|tara:strand:+ start:27796 stop:27999 length:204 start_codon:yes stop_codon:yes gene_type:complete